MSTARTMNALVRREFLEGKNGYFWTPVTLAAIVVGLVLLGGLGLGNVGVETIELGRVNIDNLGDFMSKAVERAEEKGEARHLPAAVTMIYWSFSIVVGLALPFVILFSLLGALYEERRDKSILFWKSMPVSDWQEVLAKLLMAGFGAPLVFLGIMFAAQLVIAFLLSAVVLVQGGPISELWPVGLMIGTWGQSIVVGFFKLIWMLPILTWLLFVSSFANRLPFLYAVMPIVVLIAVEAILFESAGFGRWILTHMGGWQFDTGLLDGDMNPEGPADVMNAIFSVSPFDLIGATFGDARFWIGLVVAAAFFFGTIEFRKRAI